MVSELSFSAAPQLLEGLETLAYHTVPEYPTPFGGSTPSLITLTIWRVHVDWNQLWVTSTSNLKELLASRNSIYIRQAPLECPRSGSSSRHLELPPISMIPFNPPTYTVRPRIPHTSAPIGLLRKFCLSELKRLNLEDSDYDDFVHELARMAAFLS